MKIGGFRHKGLKSLFLEDSTKGVPAECADKLRKMLAFLQDMESEEELDNIPVWRTHRLAGDRTGTWSLHVTRNRRLTFSVIAGEPKMIDDLDLEDYH